MESKTLTPALLHTDFNNAFKSGLVFQSEMENLKVETVKLGVLRLPTGKIAVHDPGWLASWADSNEFVKSVKPGNYDVFISICKPEGKTGSAGKVGAAIVRFNDNEIKRWEIALRGNETLEQEGTNELPGHSVDTGLTSYCDLSFIKGSSADELNELYEGTLVERLEDGDSDWCEIDQPNKATNFFAFKSGFGDGCYSSFWGYDSEGNVAALATDFSVLIETIIKQERFSKLSDLIGVLLKRASFEAAQLQFKIEVFDPKKKLLKLTGKGKGASEVEIWLENSAGGRISQSASSNGQGDDWTFDHRITGKADDSSVLQFKFISESRPMRVRA